MKEKESILKTKWLILAWTSLLFTVIIIGTIGGITQGDPEPIIRKLGFSDFGIFAILLHAIGMVIAVFILSSLLKRHNLSISIFFTNKVTIKSFLWALIGAALAFVLYPVVEFLAIKLSLPMYWGQTKDSHLVLGNNMSILMTIVGAVFLAPITEEIIYRGFLFEFFIRRNHSKNMSVILSILIFVSIHIMFGPGMMIYILFWSIIPFVLYIKFKSLYPSILFHIVNNLIAYIILPLNGM